MAHEQEYIPYDPTSPQPPPHPVARIVAQVVERDDIERARIFIEIERTRAGGGWQSDESVAESGFGWRRFWINFANEHPRLTMLAPVAALFYLTLFYQFLTGG